MNTLKLTIPDMKSAHCQLTVSNTVKSLGANIRSISPANATIELPEGIARETVIDAIRKAGYKVVNN